MITYLVVFFVGILIGYCSGTYHGVARGLAMKIDVDDVARRVKEYIDDHQRTA